MKMKNISSCTAWKTVTQQRDPNPYVSIDHSQRHNLALELGPRIAPWGEFDLMDLSTQQAEYLDL